MVPMGQSVLPAAVASGLPAGLPLATTDLAWISQMTRLLRHGVCAFSLENPGLPTTSCATRCWSG